MIIAFTGAGISKESGIDTFQDRPGIRDKLTRTYATRHPEKYIQVMREFRAIMNGKTPNDAHLALAEYDIPVITMNIDTLHEQAGTKELIKLHGRLPNDSEIEECNKKYNIPVLYGDPAPMYQSGYDLITLLQKGDIFLIVGASTYTNVALNMRRTAKLYGARVVEIQENASLEVRVFLETNKESIESLSDRIKLKDNEEHD